MLGRTLLGMSSSRRIGQSLRVLGGASAATAAAAGFGAATTSVVHASDGQGVGGGMWVAAATAAGVLSSTVAGPAGAAAMVAAGAGGVIATPVPHPRAVVVAGPSGVGKGTMIEKLQKDMPGTFGFSVSHATRKPRPKEVDGKDYHFVTVRAQPWAAAGGVWRKNGGGARAGGVADPLGAGCAQVEQMEASIAEGKFLEYAQVHGRYYGTSKQSVADVCDAGKVCPHALPPFLSPVTIAPCRRHPPPRLPRERARVCVAGVHPRH